MEPVADNPGMFQSKTSIAALEVPKNNRGPGQISFFAGDTIQVIYIDPEDEEDVSKQSFYAESTYPAPKQVLAQDSDCDNVADKLTITFSNAFDENYALDSVRVFIEGMSDSVTLSVPQPIQGLNEITIPLTGVNVPETATPSGTATVFLVTKGQISREMVKITDGIAPHLLIVTILENPEPRSTEDTLMIAFTEPVMLPSLGAWPLSIEGVSGDHISVSGKAITNNGGKSWLFVVTGNDNGSYIPVGGIASIKSGMNITDEALNALDPASPCAQGVKIAETPKPVPITLAEIRDNEGDGFADEIYLKFEKKLRPQDMLDSFVVEWGIKNITKSFLPADWNHTMEFGEHWQHNQQLDTLTGVVTEKEALKSIDRKVVLLFGGSLALASALDSTGAGTLIADTIVGLLGSNPNPIILLLVIFIVGCALTNFMSNTATTALMVPIASSLAASLGADPRSMIIATVIACSCAYATPIGMPANTMVVGLGGYKFNDYVKSGLPLILISFVICMVLLPILFPFYP
jgi:hypothetical protein